MNRIAIGLLAILGFAGTLPAANPPESINYQGVLRDADDSPRDGLHDMAFSFFDAATGGDLLLTDTHTGVAVNGGLFNVHLGAGIMTPGTHATLAEVFADKDEVWLEVEVGTETLSPRIRVISAAYALNAGRLEGKTSSDFIDASSSNQTKAGQLTIAPGDSYGVVAYGQSAGGYFEDSVTNSYAYVGHSAGVGIWGVGSDVGALFSTFDGNSLATVGGDNRGITAVGPETGGYFEDSDGTGYAFVGYGNQGINAFGGDAGGYFFGNNGIQASGTVMGAFLKDADGTGHAYVGYGNRGIEGYGSQAGGYFKDSDHSGYANIGIGDKGIEAYGSEMGGLFTDTDVTGEAKLAWGNHGIWASGGGVGGYFKDSDGTSAAHAAWGDTGIVAYGTGKGARLEDTDDGTWTELAVGSLGIDSNGTKSFVQNHPYDEDKLIHYSSLEGDEVGTYTRGVGRLENGVAWIRLGETFQWVTNPDIGLTAQLTARGRSADLYVDSLTTEELVVRSAEGSAPDVAFDYVVNGLRVGFEEVAAVRKKDGYGEAYIPSMASHREQYARSPELRRYSALDRFKEMTANVQGIDAAQFDLSRTAELKAAIQVYDPTIHRPVDQTETSESRETEPSNDVDTAEDDATSDADSRVPVQKPEAARILVDRQTLRTKEEPVAEVDPRTRFPASEPIAAGDILVLDMERPTHLRRAFGIADATVFGIAAAEAEMVDEAPWVELIESRYAQVKADASYGAILPGNLLVSSPTPGHAMRAIAPLPGTIVGKAAEGLDTGTGSIKILVMLR